MWKNLKQVFWTFALMICVVLGASGTVPALINFVYVLYTFSVVLLSTCLLSMSSDPSDPNDKYYVALMNNCAPLIKPTPKWQKILNKVRSFVVFTVFIYYGYFILLILALVSMLLIMMVTDKVKQYNAQNEQHPTVEQSAT